jgi:ABC-type phosphate/phosphonate transport system ATPase subunit
MAQGRIVFDGAPAALDEAAAREIYGGERDVPLEEGVTSTSIAASSTLSALARA